MTLAVRRALGLAVVAAVVVALVGCGIASDDTARDISQDALPLTLQDETTTTSSPGPGVVGEERLFLVEASADGSTEQLVPIPVRLELPDGAASLPVALVEALAEASPTELGYPTLTNSVPPDLEVVGADVRADGVLDLDVNGLATVEGSGQRLAVAQILFTLTELADVAAVRFFEDGEAVAVPIENGTASAGTPVRRSDDPDLLAALQRSGEA